MTSKTRKLAVYLLIPLMMGALAACKSKQPITRILPVVGHKPPGAVLEASEANKFHFETLSFKASTEITNNDKTQPPTS